MRASANAPPVRFIPPAIEPPMTNRAVLIEQVEAIRRRYGRVIFDAPGTGIPRETVYDASVPVWLNAAALQIRLEESGSPGAETR